MRKPCLICCFVILCCSCHNSPLESKVEQSVLSADDGEFALDPIEQRFTLPFPRDLRLDSNALIFYKTSSFDTSLVIHFDKTKESVKVVCYEVLPTYHRYINDYADTVAHLLFFEGYSFVIDSKEWQSVKERSKGILADTNTRFRNDGCADCGYGLIAYDGKVRRTGKSNRSLFEQYAHWLRDSLISRFVEKRKPIMWKKGTK